MVMLEPYFMTNKEWYYFEDQDLPERQEDINVKLTEEGKKIKKVVDSYDQYVKILEQAEKEGILL
jgi:sRNA-binding regulator protein Hfq